MNKIIGLIVIAMGFVAALFFFDSGSQLNTIGSELTKLSSVGGKTVAEAYYQDIGRYGVAIKSFMYGLSLATFSLSLGAGTLLIKKNTN